MHLHQLLLSLLLLGRWSRDTNTVAVCHTLATTLSAGIPLTQALPSAAQTCRNEVFRRATQQLTGQVESGHRLWAAMREAACFPPAMVRLVRLEEGTGRLEALLTQAGLHYEQFGSPTVKSITHDRTLPDAAHGLPCRWHHLGDLSAHILHGRSVSALALTALSRHLPSS